MLEPLEAILQLEYALKRLTGAFSPVKQITIEATTYNYLMHLIDKHHDFVRVQPIDRSKDFLFNGIKIIKGD